MNQYFKFDIVGLSWRNISGGRTYWKVGFIILISSCSQKTTSLPKDIEHFLFRVPPNYLNTIRCLKFSDIEKYLKWAFSLLLSKLSKASLLLVLDSKYSVGKSVFMHTQNRLIPMTSWSPAHIVGWQLMKSFFCGSYLLHGRWAFWV